MQKNAGFTLVELMITLVISTVILGGVAMSYMSQQKSYVSQEAVAVMQQNIRSAEFLMERDLHAVGFTDPEKNPVPPPNLGFTQANSNSCQITMDLNENGVIDSGPNTNEIVGYQLTSVNAPENLFEIQRLENAPLPPAVWTGPPVAESIDALDFVYMGYVMSVGPNPAPVLTVLNDYTNNGIVPAASLGLITSVQITIVARSTRQEVNYNLMHYQDLTMYYKNEQGRIIYTPTDPERRFQHRLITIKTQCRNQWLRAS